MMSTIRLGAQKSLSKSQLEAWLEGNETAEGPLTGIDCAEGGTVGTFNQDGDTPSRAAIILDPEGAASCPAGKTRVCGGRAYISGTCVKVLVCR